MPVGWPLHIDGAVRQCCIHRTASLQELDDMLKKYDMKRDSVEINHDAPQWSHHAVWNRKYMEPKPGYTLEQVWADSEPAVNKKRPLPMKYRQMTFSVPYRSFGIFRPHSSGQPLHTSVRNTSCPESPTTD